MKPRKPAAAAKGVDADAPQRIQKVLAEAGLGSRREIEGWIEAGRVEVNGRSAKLGDRISRDDRVRVDGKAVRLPRHQEATRVLLYKKRVGEIVTRSDPEGRRTVFRKLPPGRWIAVGRLDINTSGLLLLTNDGELARRLMHPSFTLDREYAARVHGTVTEDMLAELRRGVTLEDGAAHFEQVLPGAASGPSNRWYHVVVREGRNRLVRRLWEAVGCEVSRLIRVRFGPVALGGGIRSGSYRELEPAELAELQAAVGLGKKDGVAQRRRAARDKKKKH